jgi:VanZ family protein
MLFLLVVCIVTTVKLINVWRGAPPFRLSQRAGSPDYPRLLQSSGTSLRQWIWLTVLTWGVFASVSLYDFCDGLLTEKRTPREMFLFAIQDFSTTLTMTLLVVLFSFLARWHMLKRIEYLRHMPE